MEVQKTSPSKTSPSKTSPSKTSPSKAAIVKIHSINVAFIVFLLLAVALTIPGFASENKIVDLCEKSGTFLFPQWSPNGDKIVSMLLNDKDEFDIWMMNSDGTNLEKISSGTCSYGFGKTWSPDGKKLAFSSSNGFYSRFLIYDINSKEKKSLDIARNLDFFQWVNDLEIFYVENGKNIKNLWVIDINSKKKQHLCTLNKDDVVYQWQANGNLILYASNKTNVYQIWTISSINSNKTQLTFSPDNGYGRGMAFSPDGKQIVYASKDNANQTDISSFVGYNTGVCIMDSCGSNKKQLMPAADGMYLYPAWSPDSKRIVYEFKDAYFRSHLIIMNADGSDLALLSTNTSDRSSTISSNINSTINTIIAGSHPDWSPGNDKIVFVSKGKKNSSISVLTLDEKWCQSPSLPMQSLEYETNAQQNILKKVPGFAIYLLFAAMVLSAAVIRKKQQ